MEKMLKDKKWLCRTMLAVIALFLFGIDYAETDDSLIYTLLSKSLIEGKGFVIEGKPFEFLSSFPFEYLPSFSFIIIPFALLLGKYLIAAKVTALFLGLVSAITWFYLGKTLFNEKKYFPLLFFSPFFVLYAAFRPLSEASLICFSLLSLLFFIYAQKKPKFYYISGLCLGLASLSRLTGLALGCSYFLFVLLKQKKFKKEFVISLILGYGIFALWLIRNYFAFNSFFYVPYGAELATMPLYLKMPYHFVVLSLLSALIAGFLFIPFLFKALKNLKNGYNLLFILIIASTLLITSVGNLRIRYVAPIVPFVLLLMFAGFASMNKKGNKWKHYLLVIGLLVNFVVALWFINGHVEDISDKIYQMPPTWGQVGLRNAESIEWINKELPKNAIIIERHMIYYRSDIWKEYFRKDLSVLTYAEVQSIKKDEFYLLYDSYSDFVLNNYLVVGNEIKLHRDFLTQEEYASIYNTRLYPWKSEEYDAKRREDMLRILKAKYPNAKTLEQYLNENYIFEKVYTNKDGTKPETIVYKLRKK